MPGDERVVEVARPGVCLRLRHSQLVIEQEHQPIGSVPLSDLAVLILSSPDAILTRSVLDAVVHAGASIVICDSNHLPTAVLAPLVGHHTQTQRMIAQAESKRPTRKRMWKQIVQAKIRSQAAVLKMRIGSDHGLTEIAKQVRSGDTANTEGWAAQRYWPALFGADFRRRRDLNDQNAMLNYGYAVLRAATARAITACGLHPTLGLQHHSRSNPLCLADDLMEPYRPLVDDLVAEHIGQFPEDIGQHLSSECRARLSSVLTLRIVKDGEARTISDWLYRTASSLAAIYLGERDDLLLPEGLWDGTSCD